MQIFKKKCSCCWGITAFFYKEERSSDHLEKTGVPISTTERFKRCYSHIDTYTSTAKNIQLQQNILLNYGRGQKTDDDGAINPAQKGWPKKPGLLSEKNHTEDLTIRSACLGIKYCLVKSPLLLPHINLIPLKVTINPNTV